MATEFLSIRGSSANELPDFDGMLRHFLEAKGITRALFSRGAGLAKSSIFEVLAGKKSQSRQMIRKLAEHFDVDVSALGANL